MDAGPGAIDEGAPLTTTEHAWSYEVVDGALCGNGDPVGVAVNRSSSSHRLVVYFAGGGACWDNNTCNVIKSAASVDTGITPDLVHAFLTNAGNQGLFNRDDVNNPVRDANFVFVPYCTGDLHAGNQRDNTYGVQHVGALNVAADLKRIVPTFPDVDEVIVWGSSAGGYGALLNHERVRDAFQVHHPVAVRLLMDASPTLADPFFGHSEVHDMFAAWNLASTLPSDCADCLSYDRVFNFVHTKHSDERIGVLTATHDAVIRAFFNLTADQMALGVQAFGETVDTTSNARVFVVDGDSHVWTFPNALEATQRKGVTVATWIGAFLDDTQAWTSVR